MFKIDTTNHVTVTQLRAGNPVSETIIPVGKTAFEAAIHEAVKSDAGRSFFDYADGSLSAELVGEEMRFIYTPVTPYDGAVVRVTIDIHSLFRYLLNA